MNQDSHNTQAHSQDVLDEEALSALMDNELSDFELRRLLRRLEDHPDLLALWERFSLTRAALRAEPIRSPSSQQCRTEFSSKVLAAIAAETDTSTLHVKPAVASAWKHNAGRIAIAASVTFAVFLGMQTMLPDSHMPGQDMAELRTGNERLQIAVDTEAQQRLNDYIRSVSIPARTESQAVPYNILLESPLLRPVSDRELIEEIERE